MNVGWRKAPGTEAVRGVGAAGPVAPVRGLAAGPGADPDQLLEPLVLRRSAVIPRRGRDTNAASVSFLPPLVELPAPRAQDPAGHGTKQRWAAQTGGTGDIRGPQAPPGPHPWGPLSELPGKVLNKLSYRAAGGTRDPEKMKLGKRRIFRPGAAFGTDSTGLTSTLCFKHLFWGPAWTSGLTL